MDLNHYNRPVGQPPTLWQRLRTQWRAWISRVDPRYESIFVECHSILRSYPDLRLRSIFFGIYEEQDESAADQATLRDESGRLYSYSHAAVAVRCFWDEWGVMKLTGVRSLANIPGDDPGSMAYDYFHRSDCQGIDRAYQVRDPAAMASYVAKSLQLDSSLTGGWLRWLAWQLSGRNPDRLARLLLLVNGAGLFHTEDVRDSDPRKELEQDGAASKRIGLIMFVSEHRELSPGQLEQIKEAAFRVRCKFYDEHFIRSQACEAVRVRDDIFLSLLRALPIGQVVHDTRNILFANPAALKLLGATSLGDVANRPLMELIDPDFREVVHARMQQLRSLPMGSPLELTEERFVRIDGVPIDVEVIGVRVDYSGTDAVQMIFRDISERRRIENEREMHRLYDTLTGLPNRSLFLDRLNQAILRASMKAAEERPPDSEAKSDLSANSGLAGAPRELVGVLYIDIDNFRQVNDLFQFQAGDELLCEISARLQQFVPRDFTLSRLTGDKFCVFLPGIDATEQAVFFAEGMQDLFRLKPFKLRGESIPLTFSAGLSFYPVDGNSAEGLLSQCEIALARAKRQKNRLQLYNREMNVRTAALFELERDLLRAITREEFVLYYQPQIDTGSRTVHGVEALIRWQHPERGLVGPGEFISLAEERGMILEIGEWLLEESLAQVSEWHRAGFSELALSVNVTPRQLEHPGLVNTVQRALKRNDLDAHRLKFEIVERGIVEENERVRAAMHELAMTGIRFHVDDFGTGGAAITYLRNFPIETIKVDRSFVADLAHHEGLVRGLVAFAENLGLKTIVEGVETDSQLEFFEELGCTLIQGFYFAKPLSAEDCLRFLNDFRSNSDQAN